MKRLPQLEKLLITVFEPAIVVSQNTTVVANYGYIGDQEILLGEEEVIETFIAYNGYAFENQYRLYLYDLKEKVLDEIKLYSRKLSKSEIKKYLATIYFNLPPIKFANEKIQYKYKSRSIIESLKHTVNEFGVKVLLEDKHKSKICSFDTIGLLFYKEIFEVYERFYYHYHSPLTLAVKTKNFPPQNSEGIYSFRLSNEIVDNGFHALYFFLQGIISTDPETFRKAFTGEYIDSPLNVKWLISKGENANKAALFYFLKSDLFEHEDLLEKKFLEKVNSVFVDFHGKPLAKRLDQNLRDFNEKKDKIKNTHMPWKKKIDSIIEHILS